MKTGLLAQFPNSALIVVAMLLFLAVYLGWSWYALGRRRKDHFDAMSKLPLED